jgi:hypothetical protein
MSEWTFFTYDLAHAWHKENMTETNNIEDYRGTALEALRS